MNDLRYRWTVNAQALVLVLIIVLFSLPALAQQPAAAQAPQPPPYQWPRTHDYAVQHYRIVLRFDWSKKAVIGETTITFRPFQNGLNEVEIDAGDMTINSVKLAQGRPLKFRYEGNEKLYVTLDRAYPAGADIAVTIGYTATPAKGLTFITPTEAEPHQPYQIWSQGESETNHYWFPCYDYPNDKATSEVIATVEDKYQVISNGLLVGVERDPKKRTKTWRWRLDTPASSYLVSIIVGEFAEVKQSFKKKPVISYVYRDQMEDGRLSFAKIAQMVAFFSEKIGYDYPYAKYAETTVRDFGGGMENISATTLTDTAVHDKRASLDMSSDDLISHELAHQWFGDLLTCRDWGNTWLNESFATFFEALWTEHDKGREAYLYEMRGDQQQYLQAWYGGGNRHPIVTNRYSDPDAMFDTYTYARGAAVLNMLRFVLGEELFWKAINHYVTEYQCQPVETSQLVLAIEEATGQNLGWFFDEWVYKMGHPIFEITPLYDEAAKTLKLNVKQTQKPDDKRPWFQSPDYFTMPVDIAITTGSGEKVHRVWIDKPEKEFTFALDAKPLIINFDRGSDLIKEVKFSRGGDELAYQLLHDADVMGRVRAAIDLRTHRSEAGEKALAEAALHDSFWGVRLESVKALSGLKTEGSRQALLEAVKDKESRIRRAAIQGLAALKDPELADLYIGVTKTDPSYFAIAEAARALGQSTAPRAYETLIALLDQDSWQDTIREGAMRGLAALKDPRALDVALKYAAPGHHAGVRGPAFELLGEFGKGNDRALEVLTAALKEPSRQILFSAVQALGTLADPRAIPALEEFAKRPDLPSFARQRVIQTINRIKNAAKENQEKKSH
jgi:aminopeptidase N